jgi:Protein of unknown function (DUF3761)
MRLILAASIAASLIAAPAFVSTAGADTMKNCAAKWKTMSAVDKAKRTYKDFSSSCLKGGAAAAPPAKVVKASSAPAPAMAMKSGAAPAGATGQCKDGTYTMSKTHSGACSRHGGVAKWL